MRHRGIASGPIVAALFGVPAVASGQVAAPPPPADAPAPPAQADPHAAAPADIEVSPRDVVVIGHRGEAPVDLQPLATYDASAIAASGATSIAELLRAIRG